MARRFTIGVSAETETIYHVYAENQQEAEKQVITDDNLLCTQGEVVENFAHISHYLYRSEN